MLSSFKTGFCSRLNHTKKFSSVLGKGIKFIINIMTMARNKVRLRVSV